MNASRRYHFIILVIVGLACGHQLFQKGFDIHITFLHSYLDDVLAMPIFLALWRWEHRQWWRTSGLHKRDILLLTLLVFCLFELVLPNYISAYTADWNDGLAYCAGSGLFWWCHPRQSTVP